MRSPNFSSKIIYLLLGVVIVAVLFAMPVSAKENVKLKLPDGIYMYDSEVQRQKDGSDRVGFGKFFVVLNKNIYSSKDFVKKFGITKLNKLFGGNKKYKILCGGEVVGTKYNLKFERDEAIDRDNATFDCAESYIIKNFKEGSAYRRESIKIKGSAVKCLTVPATYKEVKKIVYTTIPQEEVDKIAKLAKEKLYPKVENRTSTQRMTLYEDNLELLDKISDHNSELYIGIYNYAFKKPWNGQWSYWDDKMIFSAKNHNVHFITGEQDESWMTICGMLDVDSDGEDELIIERTFGGIDGTTTTLEMHKQKDDGNWKMIKKISWEVRL